MGLLDGLDFVQKIPRASAEGKSPLEKAREKFIDDLEKQIALHRAERTIDQPTASSIDQSSTEKKKKPRSWVKIVGDDAYITPRVSNKPLHFGKKGSVIRTTRDNIIAVFETLQSWAETTDADPIIMKNINEAKRKRKKTPTAKPDQERHSDYTTRSEEGHPEETLQSHHDSDQ